jgi:TonB family protein
MKKMGAVLAVGNAAMLLCAGVQPAHAQVVARAETRCDSVLKSARVDSAPVTARAYLLRRDDEQLTPRARSLLIETIMAHFSLPQPLQIPVFSAGPVGTRMLKVEHLMGDSLVMRLPLLYGVYEFSLLRSGAVSKVTVAVPTLAPEFDSKVVEAILAATADSMPGMIARALDADSVPLELRITTGPEDTRIRMSGVTIFAGQFPKLRLVDAKPLPTNPPASYPKEEQDEGQDGEVALRVVVDAAGTPLIATLEVLRSTSPAFGLAAARALARYRFVPAHIGACNVPQVVEVPFWFSLRP